MRLITKFLFFFTLMFCVSSCSKDDISYDVVDMSGTVPVILVLGQSNADGHAPMSTAPSWLLGNNYKFEEYAVWNRGHKNFSTYQLGVNVGSDNNADTRFGFDIFFAKKYNEKYGKTLFCIKQTLGGVPISEKGSSRSGRWQSQPELIPNGERSMISELSVKLQEAKEYAEEKNARLDIIAILFLQGESDADESVRLADYPENFSNLVKKLRIMIGNESLPFINAEVLYRNEKYKALNLIFARCEKGDLFLRTVKTDTYQTSIGDNLHYDSQAHEYIGYTMFEYYESLK